MSKKIVGFTGFILILCVLFLGYQITRYVSFQKTGEDKRVEKVEKKLEEVNQKLQEKERTKHSLEEEKAWKIEVYKTWEKEVNPSS